MMGYASNSHKIFTFVSFPGVQIVMAAVKRLKSCKIQWFTKKNRAKFVYFLYKSLKWVKHCPCDILHNVSIPCFPGECQQPQVLLSGSFADLLGSNSASFSTFYLLLRRNPQIHTLKRCHLSIPLGLGSHFPPQIRC